MTESSGLIQEYDVFDPLKPRPHIIFIIGKSGWVTFRVIHYITCIISVLQLLFTELNLDNLLICFIVEIHCFLSIGGPGSGKGTQTAKLAAHYDFQCVSVGEILRNQLLQHAPSDRKWELIAQIIANGELAPQV